MSPLTARDPNESDREVEAAVAGEQGPVLTAVDHVGIAVEDLPEALDTYREAFDVVVEHREVDDDEGVEEALLQVGGGFIKLMAPTRDDSPLRDFLDDRGEGLHHVGYRVADLDAVLELLAAEGHELLDDEPRTGIGGRRTARVGPGALHGTTVELVEGP